jgi:hypothetical protein
MRYVNKGVDLKTRQKISLPASISLSRTVRSPKAGLEAASGTLALAADKAFAQRVPHKLENEATK